jgi:hypothetical protein
MTNGQDGLHLELMNVAVTDGYKLAQLFMVQWLVGHYRAYVAVMLLSWP